MKKLQVLLGLLLVCIFLSSCDKDDTTNDESPSNLVYDIDSNLYHTVVIGTQVWMVENLKVTRLNNGVNISEINSDDEWDTLSSAAYCWFDNDKSVYKNPYGALYNWHAVNTKKLCPVGWHIPTDSDWTILSTFIGGDSIAGGKLKSMGVLDDSTGLWHSPNTNASDEFGFCALPGGMRSSVEPHDFEEIGIIGYWWSSPDESVSSINLRFLRSNKANLYRAVGSENGGFSVRCIKD